MIRLLTHPILLVLPSHTLVPLSASSTRLVSPARSPHLFPFDPEQHAHLVPPPSDDDEPAAPSSTLAASSDDDVKDKKPRPARAPTADKAGVRGSGRGLSKEEVDTEDEESD